MIDFCGSARFRGRITALICSLSLIQSPLTLKPVNLSLSRESMHRNVLLSGTAPLSISVNFLVVSSRFGASCGLLARICLIMLGLRNTFHCYVYE